MPAGWRSLAEMADDDIVLTGVPRGGTTLACHLLNKLPDIVALHEPIQWAAAAAATPEATDALIDSFFTTTRRSLLTEGTAVSQQRNGRVPDNPMGGYRPGQRWLPRRLQGVPLLRRMALRTYRVRRGAIRVDKPLSLDFRLCIKHTGPFTARLPALTKRYRCFGLVREPVAVLSSWQTIDFALRDGRFPEVERLEPALADELAGCPERLDRQARLLAWFFDQLQRYLPAGHIIRYEEIVASGGRALAAIVPAAGSLNEPLENRNRNRFYDRRLEPALARALLAQEGAMWDFYDRVRVARLADGS